MPRKSAPRSVARRVAAVKRRRVRKAKANKKLATVGLVKKLIARNAETKLVGITHSAQHNNRINTPGDAYPLLPPLSQGTGDNDRIGNRITPKGLLVTVNVYLNDAANTPPQTILLPRILCLRDKINNDSAGLAVDFSHLLDHGQGEHAFNGNLYDYRSPINRDAFIVLKDIKTILCMGSAEMNNMYIRTFKFWIKCPKTLEYNDGQTYPTNFAPFICMGFAEGNGAVPTDGYLGVVMDHTSTLYYEDA